MGTLFKDNFSTLSADVAARIAVDEIVDMDSLIRETLQNHGDANVRQWASGVLQYLVGSKSYLMEIQNHLRKLDDEKRKQERRARVRESLSRPASVL